MSRRKLGSALLATALVVWLAFLALFVHYSATRPRAPEPDQGRVYPVNNLGSLSYVTGGEFANLFALGVAGFVASGAGYWLTRR
jgi:hypothetical protein